MNWDDGTIEDVVRAHISKAFDVCDGNIAKTAKLVGMSRANLYRRLKEFGLYPRKQAIVQPKITGIRKKIKNDVRAE